MQTIPDEVVLGAQAGQARYFVPSSVSIAQWALESSWGVHMPTGSRNPFGIKAKEGQPYVEAMTWEVINGHDARVVQRFAKYASLAEAFEAHARLLATAGLYKPAMDAWYHQRSLVAGVSLMAAHYATDPAYGSKLMSIITTNDLVRFDSLPIDRGRPVVIGATSSPVAPAGTDPLSQIADAVSKATGVPNLLPGGPSPAVPVPHATTKESTSMSVTTATTPNAALVTMSDFFKGVIGKLETAGTMTASGSSIATGVVTSLPEIPTIVGEISKLVIDMETGRWTSAPSDIVALVLEFTKISGKFGLDMSALTSFVSKLPFQPAVVAAA